VTPIAAAKAAAAAAVAEIQGDLVDGREAFTVDDSVLEDTARRIATSGVIERLETWTAEDAKGPGGRPARFPISALLVVMFTCARLGRPMLVTEWLRIIRNMTPKARADLGFPDAPRVDQPQESAAYYRNLRTRFHKVEALMDFSPYVRNRRLPADEMAPLMVRRMAELTPKRVDQLKARQEWFINRILRISLGAVPKDLIRLWGGGLAVDATPVATFARGPRRAGKPERSAPQGRERANAHHAVGPLEQPAGLLRDIPPARAGVLSSFLGGFCRKPLVWPVGFEPTTPASQTRCATKLRYGQSAATVPGAPRPPGAGWSRRPGVWSGT
jgi:hypothetical protein